MSGSELDSEVFEDAGVSGEGVECSCDEATVAWVELEEDLLCIRGNDG